jgi:hypothetical protein
MCEKINQWRNDSPVLKGVILVLLAVLDTGRLEGPSKAGKGTRRENNAQCGVNSLAFEGSQF